MNAKGARNFDEDDGDREDGEVIDLPDTGLPPAESGPGKKCGRKRLPERPIDADITDLLPFNFAKTAA